MRRAQRVDVDAGALASKPAGRAAVIQVDVCQQHIGDIGGRKPIAFQLAAQPGQGRAWTAFDQDCPVGMRDQINGNRSRDALELQVKGMDRRHRLDQWIPESGIYRLAASLFM